MINRLFNILLFTCTIAYGQQTLFSVQGLQPAICVGDKGNISMVFGKNNVIYYSSSKAQAQSFSSPVRVDSLPGLHLGVSRGPQIASSLKATVITAIDKAGNLYAYALNRKTGKWQNRLLINDVPEIAKEGFNALGCNEKGDFFVIWLDLRGDHKNKLYGAVSRDGGLTWSKNQLIYRSPDSTICECCQPSVVMHNNKIAVLFRNYIDGSRDMYLAVSEDSGKSFQPAVKMGDGTWKLNACPMDGGGISISKRGDLVTVWRRENQIFMSMPGKPEIRLGEGRNATVAAGTANTYVAWHHQGAVFLFKPDQKELIRLGAGRYPRLAMLDERHAFCTWEDNGYIKGLVLEGNNK